MIRVIFTKAIGFLLALFTFFTWLVLFSTLIYLMAFLNISNIWVFYISLFISISLAIFAYILVFEPIYDNFIFYNYKVDNINLKDIKVKKSITDNYIYKGVHSKISWQDEIELYWRINNGKSKYKYSNYRVISFIEYDLRKSKDGKTYRPFMIHRRLNDFSEKELNNGDTLYLTDDFKKNTGFITIPIVYQGIFNISIKQPNDLYFGYLTALNQSKAYIEIESCKNYLQDVVVLKYLGNSSSRFNNKIKNTIYLGKAALFQRLVRINNIDVPNRKEIINKVNTSI